MPTKLHTIRAKDQIRGLAFLVAADTDDDLLDTAANVEAMLDGLWDAGARPSQLLAGRAVTRIRLNDARAIAGNLVEGRRAG